MSSKFYITTPIYYVNDKPHIGHAYTTILADVLARFHRARGQDVFFLTGLDEHGQKVQQAAEQRGLSPQQHCDDLAPRFIELWERLHIRYDDFIRTTQPRHVRVVQKVLGTVYEAGDIYMDEYEGYYSVAEERFITETELRSGQFRDVKTIKEKNYFFRMSRYQARLVETIQSSEGFILPPHRRNEILGFLRQPLGDLCISRPKSRLNWGIEIPFDRDYVTYVWFDALLNYISAIGYPDDEERFRYWWPADVHLIGKDILTTHAVYWPTMLFSLNLPLPRCIFAHGWWLVGETKMSKSLGNIISPMDLIERFDVDAVRYYLMREMVLGQDAQFTWDGFVKRYNSDLANDFGNLLNRVGGLLRKHFNGRIPARGPVQTADEALIGLAVDLPQRVDERIQSYQVHEAIDAVMELIRRANRYLEEQAPWRLIKEDTGRAQTVLHCACEALRLAAVLLEPVMPTKTRELLNVLGAAGSPRMWGGLPTGQTIGEHAPLFPRIETDP